MTLSALVKYWCKMKYIELRMMKAILHPFLNISKYHFLGSFI